MSGNYDYPPASRRMSGPQYQNLRSLLDSADRNLSHDHINRALQVFREEVQDNVEQTRAVVNRHGQQLQPGPYDIANNQSSLSLSAPLSQESSMSDSTTTTPGGRFPRRHLLTPVERVARDSRSRESELEPFLADSLLNAESSSSSARPDLGLHRWRTKRRKLDSDDDRGRVRGFSYGQYGQVVPGALKMDIVSCDGGVYEPGGDSCWPENILRNDSSVYCTKSDRCNLILKHRGGTPFSLKKIVIKAPRSGFDAPIREGMVFVAMNSDGLLPRTAHCQNRIRRRHHRRYAMEQLQNYLTSSYPSPLQSSAPGNFISESDEEDGRGLPTSNFRVTTAYDDHSDEGDKNEDSEGDGEYPSVAEIESVPVDEDLMCPSDDSESDEDDEDGDDDDGFDSTIRQHILEREIRNNRPLLRDSLDDNNNNNNQGLHGRRLMSALLDQAASNTSTRGSGSHLSAGSNNNSDSDILEPHAHFFIEREKNMVSIKFDPPPSGRFVLVKLWSPYNRGNIDIQSVIVHGFAGPRFFPAGGFR